MMLVLFFENHDGGWDKNFVHSCHIHILSHPCLKTLIFNLTPALSIRRHSTFTIYYWLSNFISLFQKWHFFSSTIQNQKIGYSWNKKNHFSHMKWIYFSIILRILIIFHLFYKKWIDFPNICEKTWIFLSHDLIW